MKSDVEKIREALLAAVQLCDGIQRLIGLPFRPSVLQPIFDGWHIVSDLECEVKSLRQENGSLKDYIRHLEAK